MRLTLSYYQRLRLFLLLKNWYLHSTILLLWFIPSKNYRLVKTFLFCFFISNLRRGKQCRQFQISNRLFIKLGSLFFGILVFSFKMKVILADNIFLLLILWIFIMPINCFVGYIELLVTEHVDPFLGILLGIRFSWLAFLVIGRLPYELMHHI